MRRLILVPMFAALMALGTAAQAQQLDKCDDESRGLFPSEAGLCQAYCTHMECDLIDDGDPLSAPQASAGACTNVAVSFMAQVNGVPRSEVDPYLATCVLDNGYCWARNDVPPPGGGCF